jgi:hypothetical protein
MTTSTPLFESTTCSRCTGSGKYSWCSAHGSTCFKCGGRGWVLTKRGAAAAAKFRELLSKPTSELVAGDKIRVDGFNAGSFNQPTRWYTVREVKPITRAIGSSTVDGKTVEFGPGLFEVICDGHDSVGVAADALFRVANDGPAKAAKLQEALAYQDTLTKSGTVKVRKAA